MSALPLTRAARFELTKLLAGRAWWVLAVLVVGVQALLGLIEGSQIAQIGVDATPATEPSLAGPLPPVGFFGFDVLPFGEAVVVVVAAVLGSAEFRNGELRTTLLAVNSRLRSLLSKLLAFTGSLALVSAVSVVATIAGTNAGLGSQGLGLAALPGAVWVLMAKATAYWCVLGLLTYGVAIVARSWIVPLALLLPQVMGLDEWVAHRWSAGTYLPVSAGRCWTATPEALCEASGVVDVTALSAWAALAVVAGAVVFARRDVGAR